MLKTEVLVRDALEQSAVTHVSSQQEEMVGPMLHEIQFDVPIEEIRRKQNVKDKGSIVGEESVNRNEVMSAFSFSRGDREEKKVLHTGLRTEDFMSHENPTDAPRTQTALQDESSHASRMEVLERFFDVASHNMPERHPYSRSDTREFLVKISNEDVNGDKDASVNGGDTIEPSK
jgi:hypothetical protein